MPSKSSRMKSKTESKKLNEQTINQLRKELKKVSLALTKAKEQVDDALKIVDQKSQAPTKVILKDEKKELASTDYYVDVFSDYHKYGYAFVKTKLLNSNYSYLKNTISKYGLDPTRRTKDWTDKEKLVGAILERLSESMDQGKAFQ